MISVPAPAGATMAYRLDPYSVEVISHKPKSMHDVVEPTILFYHRKKGGAGPTHGSPSAAGSSSSSSPQSTWKGGHRSSASSHMDYNSCSPVSSCKSAPRSPAVFSSPTPTHKAPTAASAPGSVRYITASTLTNQSITLVAPFRVAAGDNVVFQANDNGGEHFGTVTYVFDANYIPASVTTIRRLIRKARSVDQEAQRRNAKEIEVVRSTIAAVLQNARPGGFAPSSLSAVEWQLDRTVLNVQLTYDATQDADLHSLYIQLVKQLGCEVYIVSNFTPQSSPALSDCGASSMGEPSYADFC